MIWQAPPKDQQPATERPGLGWWALMIACVLFPPLGLVCLGVLAWRKWKG